jgi:BlaI family penicillinase repressor
LLGVMPGRPALRLSDAEWTVMRAVWERPPASARDVLDRAGSETGWAYTTVKTLLARLVEKGALRMTMRGNVSLYEPRVTMRQARIAAVRALIDRAFDGTFGSLLQHLIAEEKLSAKDRAALARLIEDAGAEREKRS